MKLRIAQKKLKSSTVNIWAKSIDEWMQARDVANKLNDTNEIANLIVDTCVIKYMMKPRINIKATDEVD